MNVIATDAESLSDGLLSIRRNAIRTDVIRLDWTGRSTSRQPNAVLDPFLDRALDEARKRKVRIELHFELLEYFNSSTVASLVKFIQRARTARVPVVFAYEPQISWQKLSFDALRVFEHVDSLVHVVPAREA